MRSIVVSASLRRSVCLAVAVVAVPDMAGADDPSCASMESRARVLFAARGPVDFGPGFMGTLGSSALGLDYNFLLMGDYDWAMPGELVARWPPAMRISAVGDMNGGRLTVQYGLRLQASFRLFGATIPLPVAEWVGMADRSERGMSMFTPWAWQPEPTAVRVTASERLLRTGVFNGVPVVGNVTYWLWGSYELTTTVRTREISFPQANSSITEMTPEADVPPTANGDTDIPTQWNGMLRFVGALRLRLNVEYDLCVLGVCTRRRENIPTSAIPFASRMEQQMSVDRSVRFSMPGLEVMPSFQVDLGRVRLGLQGREVITLRNPGRQTVAVTPSAPGDTQFEVTTDPMCIPGGSSRTLSVRFTPRTAGPFETTMNLRATAPGVSGTMLRLVGEGVGTTVSDDAGTTISDSGTAAPTDSGTPPVEDSGTVDPTDAGAATDSGSELLFEQPDGGCGCRVGDKRQSESDALRWAALALGIAAMARRRRRG